MKTLKIIFFATLVLGAISYYLLYSIEDYCSFSSCVDLVPSMQQEQSTQPKQTPTRKGPQELDNGR